MQVVIDLPDELGKKLLGFPNMQMFVQEAVKKMLLEEQRKQASLEIKSLMSSVPASVSLVDELIADRRIEANKEL
ncbi:MAG: AbrB family transcriptional regulator [Dolichospermum sp. DET50]|jgi:hypothetical protein|nr:AbrB family transcriptional regulator [Dolichospermum sp. DET66]MBS3030913.1 AbrB family transcriptional regulator [Dolichospermum sp. DET67]MBS3036123.1 AbrB family transcriptional regulator [Dolichospermum sp. DET50]QSX68200.1 MAG: hypothetical protein EZY12_00275 [Dolichospermum sp. DET69]